MPSGAGLGASPVLTVGLVLIWVLGCEVRACVTGAVRLPLEECPVPWAYESGANTSARCSPQFLNREQ